MITTKAFYLWVKVSAKLTDEGNVRKVNNF